MEAIIQELMIRFEWKPVWLMTVDGSIQQVELEVAMFCPFIYNEMLEGIGSSKTNAVLLPDLVNPEMLNLILDYCRFHQDIRHSFEERVAFDDNFFLLDTKKLCKLMSAADSLQLTSLVDYIGAIIAHDEKLEPPKNATDDTRIRLLNRLYVRKKKDLKDVKEEIAEIEEEPVDNRSVDDLLSFINGEEKECKVGKTKKKNRKKKSQSKVSKMSINEIRDHKEGNDPSLSCKNGKSGPCSEFPDPTSPFSHNHEFDADYTDDELDPVMKEELDREVEEFARRLNLVWPERIQQLLSSGPEERRASISTSRDGFTKERIQQLLSSGPEERRASISTSRDGFTKGSQQ